jgi:transposase
MDVKSTANQRTLRSKRALTELGPKRALTELGPKKALRELGHKVKSINTAPMKKKRYA